MPLIEIGDCVFDRKQFELSHGFEDLDLVAQEAFVNHWHLSGKNPSLEADKIINLNWLKVFDRHLAKRHPPVP